MKAENEMSSCSYYILMIFAGEPCTDTLPHERYRLVLRSNSQKGLLSVFAYDVVADEVSSSVFGKFLSCHFDQIAPSISLLFLNEVKNLPDCQICDSLV